MYLNGESLFGKLVGKYTSPMDPMDYAIIKDPPFVDQLALAIEGDVFRAHLRIDVFPLSSFEFSEVLH